MSGRWVTVAAANPTNVVPANSERDCIGTDDGSTDGLQSDDWTGTLSEDDYFALPDSYLEYEWQ
ncbi:MAG: hypothetical protein R3A46_17660 [Thermomicrobiales bacterium]